MKFGYKCLLLARLRMVGFGILLLPMFFPSAAVAGNVIATVITKVGVDKNFPGLVFISVDKPKDTNPACQTDGNWTYVLPAASEDDKRIYAMLLAARASQTPVTFFGSGACNVFGTIETLSVAYY